MSNDQLRAASSERRKFQQSYRDVVTPLLEDHQVALADIAYGGHKHLVEMSHIARLAAERLNQLTVDQGANERDLAAIKAMLQEIEVVGHQAFLKRYGAKDDYETIGTAMERKYRTPSGRWRA